MKLWPNCREVSEAAANGERRPLVGRLRLLAHLAVCAGCRRFVRQLSLIRSALTQRVFRQPDAAQVEGLRRAVLARLKP